MCIYLAYELSVCGERNRKTIHHIHTRTQRAKRMRNGRKKNRVKGKTSTTWRVQDRPPGPVYIHHYIYIICKCIYNQSWRRTVITPQVYVSPRDVGTGSSTMLSLEIQPTVKPFINDGEEHGKRDHILESLCALLCLPPSSRYSRLSFTLCAYHLPYASRPYYPAPLSSKEHSRCWALERKWSRARY